MIRRRNAKGLRRHALAVLLLFLAALAPQSALAQYDRFAFPPQYAMTPTGVNLQTGRFIYSKTDLSIGTLSLTRTWGDVPAVTADDRSFGPLMIPSLIGATVSNGWAHNFNQGVIYRQINDTSYPRLFVLADGKMYTFFQLSDGALVPGDKGTNGTMVTFEGGKWNFRDRSGNLYVYASHPAMQPSGFGSAPNQLIESIIYANGARLDFTYTSAGRPRFVASNAGFAIGLEYNGSGSVSAACGFNLAEAYADAGTPCSAAPVKVGYGYDGNGQLASVTNPLGHTSSITYANTLPGSTTPYFAPACITIPGSSTCEITNFYGGGGYFGDFDQVGRQLTADGKEWKYEYFPQHDPADLPIQLGMPRYSFSYAIGPDNQGISIRLDRGRVIDEATPAGARYYRYKYVQVAQGTINSYYNLPANPVEYFDDSVGLEIQPDGTHEYYGHDNRGNITMRATLLGNPLPTSNPNWENCCISVGTPSLPPGSISATRTFMPDFGAISLAGSVFVLGCGSGPADARLCDKPLTVTDGRGNTTEYTYDPAHGGVLTETGPAVDGIRPQVRYSYAQRHAWLRAAGGGYVQSAWPVWVLTQKSICRTGASTPTGCAIAGDELVTTYDYGPASGPNNLLLRSVTETAPGLERRTCYRYDQFGNKIAETQPNGASNGCP